MSDRFLASSQEGVSIPPGFIGMLYYFNSDYTGVCYRPAVYISPRYILSAPGSGKLESCLDTFQGLGHTGFLISVLSPGQPLLIVRCIS